MKATMDLLRDSFSRLSGATQMRVLLDALPTMTADEQIALVPAIVPALQPHLARPLLDALNERISAEGIGA